MTSPHARFINLPGITFGLENENMNEVTFLNAYFSGTYFRDDNDGNASDKDIFITIYFGTADSPETNHFGYITINNNGDGIFTLETNHQLYTPAGEINGVPYVTDTHNGKYIYLKFYLNNINGIFLGSAKSRNTIRDTYENSINAYTVYFEEWYSDENLSLRWQNNILGIHCLLKGTQILTPEGYKPIESLSKGDEIINIDKQTRKINNVYYQKVKVDLNDEERDKYKDKYQLKGDSGLILTGGHMVKLDNEYHLPINSDRFENVQEDQGENEYYHLELDEYDYFIANGVEVESLTRNELEKHAFYKERGINFNDLVK